VNSALAPGFAVRVCFNLVVTQGGQQGR
jgi:hypothetical protein